jgi:hypothetical protein
MDEADFHSVPMKEYRTPSSAEIVPEEVATLKSNTLPFSTFLMAGVAAAGCEGAVGSVGDRATQD